MKTIIKIEAIVLAVILLVGAVLCLLSAGALMWLKEPVPVVHTAQPIPTDPAEPEAGKAEAVFTEETAANLPHTREITAQRYFVYDVRTGQYLQQKGELDEKLYPASITKLLSVYVMLQYMDPEETVTVGDALSLVQPDSSVAWLQAGDKLTVSQLVAAMMLPSGNDAAQTAAVATGRVIADNPNLAPAEASQVFVKEMNAQAQALGMTGTHFANADGFHDENHYTTMEDLRILAEKVLADPTIVSYTSRAEETVELLEGERTWKNTNFLVQPQMETYISSTIGLKTGYTSAAGNCLMSAFFLEDRLLIIGVFGTPAHTEDRFLDTVELFNTTVIS